MAILICSRGWLVASKQTNNKKTKVAVRSRNYSRARTCSTLNNKLDKSIRRGKAGSLLFSQKKKQLVLVFVHLQRAMNTVQIPLMV
jgi:hypothetical protein